MIPNIENTIHLIWTDALFAIQAAKTQEDKWFRGTFVRWAVISAWTTLELACGDATGSSVGKRFKEDLETAIANNKFPSITFGTGIWQKVMTLKNTRVDAVHTVSDEIIFPECYIAEDAITIIRDAIKDIYKTCRKPIPTWIDEEYNFQTSGLSGQSEVAANLQAIYVDAQNDPQKIRISYTLNGVEHPIGTYPKDFDFKAEIERLKKGFTVPVNKIIVYRGDDIFHEEELNLKGSK